MTDPRKTIASLPLSRFQILVIIYCTLLNALDGFDVLSISFAAPGIASEWNITRGTLGFVLAMELFGMAIGSIILGLFADKMGRRPILLTSLVIMSSGMFLASIADTLYGLSVVRLWTGLGIGGMLAATNAMVAEFSNAKRRSLAVVIMATGYPVGVIIGGTIASYLLVSFDWRSIFVFGGVVSLLFLPLIWFSIPESVSFLIQKGPPNALKKVNGILARMGREKVSALPEADSNSKPLTKSLFSKNIALTTFLLTAAYFAHIMTFYFILKWIPKIVVDMGFAPSLAGTVLVWASVGGATGSIVLGLLSQKIDVRRLVILALILASGMIIYFGQGQDGLTKLSIVAAVAGFFTNSAVVGLYAIIASSFPTELRATGTGFVIGVGRGGAALGPIVAGLLFSAGFGLNVVAGVMAIGSIIAAIAIFVLIKVVKPSLN
ncbi:MAG: MFS transporter [Alphaproteobacteria bacterium]|nr:MAG: MFS transporter [Alphaproteobacteria bacterium]